MIAVIKTDNGIRCRTHKTKGAIIRGKDKRKRDAPYYLYRALGIDPTIGLLGDKAADGVSYAHDTIFPTKGCGKIDAIGNQKVLSPHTSPQSLKEYAIALVFVSYK